MILIVTKHILDIARWTRSGPEPRTRRSPLIQDLSARAGGECRASGKRVVNPRGCPAHQVTRKPRNPGLVALDLGCWWASKSSIRLSSKFVGEVLLCFSEIELVDHEKFASAALLELADQNRI